MTPSKNPYEENRGIPSMFWMLAVLAIVAIATAYILRATSGGPPPPQAAPVAYRGIVDCSQSMPCSEKYFHDAFLPAREASQQKTAPPGGIDFECPSDVLVYQVGTNLSVAPFASEIIQKAFGMNGDRACTDNRKQARKNLEHYIHGITAVSAKHSGETNLLELLNTMRRPSPRHRLRIVLATDAAQSTKNSEIDMDARPLTSRTVDAVIVTALKHYGSLPEMDHAELQFILPARGENETPANPQELLERFWTGYLKQAAPTASIVNFSTQPVAWSAQ